MKKTIFAALSALLISLSVQAEGAGFDYQLERVATRFEACEAFAPSVSASFSSVTGREVLSVSCERISVRIYNLVLTYAGEERLDLISTWDEWAQSQGTFADSASCRAQIEAEVANFEIKTGLKAVVSFCYAETEATDEPHPWVLRVDGFGKTRLRPRILERSIYATPLRSLRDISVDIEQRAAAEGLVQPRALIDFSGGLFRLVLKYYSEFDPPMALVNWTSYESVEACVRGTEEISAILKKLDVEILGDFCAQREFRAIVDLYLVPYVKGSYGHETYEQTYGTQGACEAERERVSQLFREERQIDVVGAICAYQESAIFSPRGYFMQLFWRS